MHQKLEGQKLVMMQIPDSISFAFTFTEDVPFSNFLSKYYAIDTIKLVHLTFQTLKLWEQLSGSYPKIQLIHKEDFVLLL